MYEGAFSFWSSPPALFSVGEDDAMAAAVRLTDRQTENTVCVGLEINGFITTMLQSGSSDLYRSPRRTASNL